MMFVDKEGPHYGYAIISRALNNTGGTVITEHWSQKCKLWYGHPCTWSFPSASNFRKTSATLAAWQVWRPGREIVH